MMFDQLNDEQFDAWLARSMRARPEPTAPANLATRAIALARQAPVAASATLAHAFRWKRFSAIAAAVLMLCVLAAGALRLEKLQSSSGNLATLSNLNALWNGDSSASDSAAAGSSGSDSSTGDSSVNDTNATVATDASSASKTDSISTDSSASDGSLSALLDSSGTQGWMLLAGAAAIGALVILLTARSLSADDGPLISSDSIFA